MNIAEEIVEAKSQRPHWRIFVDSFVLGVGQALGWAVVIYAVLAWMGKI